MDLSPLSVIICDLVFLKSKVLLFRAIVGEIFAAASLFFSFTTATAATGATGPTSLGNHGT